MAESDPLALLARLSAVHAADEGRAETELRSRDADIGRRMAPTSSDRERLLGWLQAVSPSMHHGLPSSVGTAGALVVLGGCLLGLLSAATLFYYDGSGRVNALAVLGVLVGMPTVLLLGSWLSCLSVTRARVWPLVGDLFGALARLSPGRFTAWLAARMTRGDVEHLSVLLPAGYANGSALAAQPVLVRVRTWFFARWAHLASVGFFLGALVAMLALVVFTDLVFGWSTTLKLSPAEMHRVVQLVALPWGWALPEAVPSLELVTASRYFRAADPIHNVAELSALGQWWPFLCMCVFTYGAVPRVVSAMISRHVLHRVADAAFAAHPGSVTVLQRLQAASDRQPAVDAGADLALPRTSTSGFQAARIVNWAQVPIVDAVLREYFGAASILQAGGTRSISEDEEAIRAAANDPDVATAIIAKAWEPPILDLADFAADLRAQLEAPVTVVPVNVAEGAPASVSCNDESVWRRSFDATDVELIFVDVMPADEDGK